MTAHRQLVFINNNYTHTHYTVALSDLFCVHGRVKIILLTCLLTYLQNANNCTSNEHTSLTNQSMC